MRDCPKRGKLNALVAEANYDESGSTRVNPLQLVSALQERPAKHKGLMYVQVQINGKAVMAMLDSGPTHNFVADREIQKHAAHSGRTGLADALAELGSMAQHPAVVRSRSTAVTLGRLRTVSKLSGRQLTASELHGSVCASLRHSLYLCMVINATLGIFPSKLKTSAVRLRERADWFGRNQAAQWAEKTEDS
ncbi:UNVERIFIED_CONTAM: hypothetical protein Sangu_3114200 [Sesamum angustifolium]|uniref:Uncharacterized protein n=1 Tax=Sesamum angustifolium TaxID=2727405 RepID=A0AAW2K5U9_9LAMI